MPRLTPAVVRTFDILELFLDAPGSLAAADVVRLTGVPRTSAHELLSTLVSRGYLQREDDTGKYRLGERILQLGNAYSARFDMLSAANQAARTLSAESDETVSVALLERADVFYLAKVESRETLRLPSSIGQRLPANATALGKAMLAYLAPPELAALWPDPDALPRMTPDTLVTLSALERDLQLVRASGVAVEREESTPGICCAASPVRDVSGAVVAAISVSIPRARWESTPVEHWGALAQRGAADLSRRLGYSVAPA